MPTVDPRTQANLDALGAEKKRRRKVLEHEERMDRIKAEIQEDWDREEANRHGTAKKLPRPYEDESTEEPEPPRAVEPLLRQLQEWHDDRMSRYQGVFAQIPRSRIPKKTD